MASEILDQAPISIMSAAKDSRNLRLLGRTSAMGLDHSKDEASISASNRLLSAATISKSHVAL